MVRLYAVLCVFGAALPLWFFFSFVADEGLDVGAFFDQMTDSDISLLAWADVVVAALVVIAFAIYDRCRGWGLAVVATRCGRALAWIAALTAPARTRTYV